MSLELKKQREECLNKGSNVNVKHKVKQCSFVKATVFGLYVAFAGSILDSKAEDFANFEESASIEGEIQVAQTSQREVNRPIDLSNPTGVANDSEETKQQSNTSEQSANSSTTKRGLGKKYEGIWGMSENTCVRTRKIEDILDGQTLAIKGNRIYFVDSQCLILESKDDSGLGQTAKVRCIDVDGQRIETELKFKPVGALKLEISSEFQSSRQYVYCAGFSD